MLWKTVSRCVHISIPHLAKASPAKVDASLLSRLRKNTGYSFANCRKALDVFGDDLERAELWLKEQAKKEGWAKATKLQNRVALQGLLGLAVRPNLGVIVEVNCETDFVARNARFRNLVAEVVSTCVENCSFGAIDRHHLSASELSAMHSPHSDKSLANLVASEVGQIGENIVLRRAGILRVAPPVRLCGYVHPAEAPSDSNILLGKFGALLAYSTNGNSSEESHALARQVCQHIVGMNPTQIGSLEEFRESGAPQKQDEVKESEETHKDGESGGKEESEHDEELQTSSIDDSEERLVFQKYLLDDTIQVGNVLLDNGLDVVNFMRFECGEVQS
ncbi:unnamed protein product [Darwinula stevensoni]|uniref:Elongation factor Ts, mitochondrial n=1 Tax=Darwinula stevensoni TaxID=69355 RepID=A0A7R8X6A7_9CRUS|nr:unnamed protein product [Darwinula stevensoni]CAG0885705.1 unnamed protein product [Darwinula stevensoni]